ncbi:MAG: nucleoside triphosphate pyrophosphohydrolase family protein [Malacoplasma sp.]|nr:nucleoside triphosphate pyrophosphohydrolase family protein [Malacoplasma sp.]
MTIKEYQDFCKKEVKNSKLEVMALGLAGESGEVCDIVKKAYRDNKPIDLPHIMEEIGDVCWYVANLCSHFNVDMEYMLSKNVEKLTARYNIKEEK